MAQTADYGLGEYTVPRGWFMVAEGSEVSATPSTIHYFGRDFVLYRGESVTAHMVDAYCPHLGAQLAKNTTSYIVRDGQQVEGSARPGGPHLSQRAQARPVSGQCARGQD